MLRVATGRRTFAAAVVVSSQRRSLAFTCQSSELSRVADERGYESQTWVAVEDDKWWYSKSTTPKSPAKAIKAMLPKRLELFNEDQLKAPLSSTPVDQHTSYSTQKPYKGQMIKELDQRALLHDYTSKMWLTPNVVRQKQLFLKPRAKPHVLLIRVPIDVLHVSEFDNPDAILKTPFAGDTARPLSGDVGVTLSAAMHERKQLIAPVWFSTAAMNDMQLSPSAGAIGVTSVSSEVNTFYNIESFANFEALRAQAPADYVASPATPRYLTTGTPIAAPHAIEALSNSGHKESLWMSAKDLEFKQRGAGAEMFALKPGAPSVSLPAFVANWFCIDDLESPMAALKAVGTLTR